LFRHNHYPEDSEHDLVYLCLSEESHGVEEVGGALPTDRFVFLETVDLRAVRL
jgi:hypothetical protein